MKKQILEASLGRCTFHIHTHHMTVAGMLVHCGKKQE